MIQNIQMVDLIGQYKKIKPEIDVAIQEVFDSGRFIKGPAVANFEEELANYLNVNHVITCANGTDALQVVLMALLLQPGDEVIIPTFNYAATIEVVILLGLKPILVDVDYGTCNVRPEIIEKAITHKTKAIVPVNLFGQSADIESIMQVAEKYGIAVVEDNAQAMGSEVLMSDRGTRKSGTVGHIACTSFFPSKNLGCYGDGGAIYTDDTKMAERIRMITNHGQIKKHQHKVVGVNSRLDAIQAAILSIKLKKLEEYSNARQKVANIYDAAFSNISELELPARNPNSTHVFHQYTIKIKNGKRDLLKEALTVSDIPSMIYYPLPLYCQEAYKPFYNGPKLPVTERLCQEVLSLPIHTEMNEDTQNYIIQKVMEFFNGS